jgi:hypothetical protein
LVNSDSIRSRCSCSCLRAISRLRSSSRMRLTSCYRCFSVRSRWRCSSFAAALRCFSSPISRYLVVYTSCSTSYAISLCYFLAIFSIARFSRSSIAEFPPPVLLVITTDPGPIPYEPIPYLSIFFRSLHTSENSFARLFSLALTAFSRIFGMALLPISARICSFDLYKSSHGSIP